MDSETAQAIVTVAGVSAKGRRLGPVAGVGRSPDIIAIAGAEPAQHSRNAGPALLGVLVTCALRRGELSRMNCEHLAMRDGRWVFLDFLGEGKQDAVGGGAAVGEASDR